MPGIVIVVWGLRFCYGRNPDASQFLSRFVAFVVFLRFAIIAGPLVVLAVLAPSP